jgi:hypothetical protein
MKKDEFVFLGLMGLCVLIITLTIYYATTGANFNFSTPKFFYQLKESFSQVENDRDKGYVPGDSYEEDETGNPGESKDFETLTRDEIRTEAKLKFHYYVYEFEVENGDFQGIYSNEPFEFWVGRSIQPDSDRVMYTYWVHVAEEDLELEYNVYCGVDGSWDTSRYTQYGHDLWGSTHMGCDAEQLQFVFYQKGESDTPIEEITFDFKGTKQELLEDESWKELG